jgi:fumarate reductase flavoprotein subunit
MAHELGAAEEGIEVLELLRTGRNTPETRNQVAFTVVQPYLWVNGRGERFCNECVTFEDTSMGNANVKQKDGLSFSLFDMTTIRRLMEKGIDKAMAMDFPPGTPLDMLDREFEEEARTRPEDVFKADSIKDLAKQINVDPETLQHTVDEYNSFAKQGHDPLFSKNPQYLFPLTESPFYAVRAQTVFLGTMGGIKINHQTEVLDSNDNTIPGLYAGGFDAGGMYGDSYGIRYSTGLSSGFAVNSGRLAGKNSLKYLFSF